MPNGQPGNDRKRFSRRQALRTTAAIGAGSLLGSRASAQSDDPIFAEDFEAYGSGELPEGFVLAGSTDQGVTSSTSATGSQSFRMSGSHGGCWRAIMRTELFEDASRPEAMRISGHFRLAGGGVGCHENKSGRIGWRTVASPNWSEGSGPEILQFRPTGEVTAAGEVLGEYERDEWIEFSVEYRWNRDTGEVTQTCTIADGSSETVTREQRDDEANLTALELRSDDFTVFWDGLTIETIDEESTEDSEPEPEPDPEPEPEVDAKLSSFETSNGAVEPGDSVSSTVVVENTGTVEHTFFVGYSVVAPTGKLFDNGGTTGHGVTLSAGESTSVDLSWTATTDAPSGTYDAIAAVWKEADRDSLETRLAIKRNETSFELEGGDLPDGTSILPPATPDTFPYVDTQQLVFEGIGPDRDGVEGAGIRVRIDRTRPSENELGLTIGIDSPEESMIGEISGHQASQLLVIYDDEQITLDPSSLRSRVDGGTPAGLEKANVVGDLASLVSLGTASSLFAIIKEGVKSIAETVAEEWATSQLSFKTPPNLEEDGDHALARIDFSTETVPGVTSPATIDEYTLEATFTGVDADAEAPIVVVADMRGWTEPVFTPADGSRITGAGVQTHEYPVEYRRQVTVPTFDDAKSADDRDQSNDEDGQDDSADKSAENDREASSDENSGNRPDDKNTGGSSDGSDENGEAGTASDGTDEDTEDRSERDDGSGNRGGSDGSGDDTEGGSGVLRDLSDLISSVFG